MGLIKGSLGVLLLLASVQALPSPDPTIHSPSTYFRRVSSGFFSTDPLTSVRRSFQDIQAGVGRSMKSLFAAGSDIGRRMLGMITRAPRLLSSAPLLFSPPQIHEPVVAPSSHHPAPAHAPNFPDFDDCDCHFGQEDLSPAKFQPISDNSLSYAPPAPQRDTYGSPVAPLAEAYSPPEDTYLSPSGSSAPLVAVHSAVHSSSAPLTVVHSSAPLTVVHSSPPVTVLHSVVHSSAPLVAVPAPNPQDNSIHDLSIPDKVHEAVIHPGGGDAKEHLDVHKVEVLGAASVVQSPSARFPDQAHPEKYMNFDTAWLDTVVHHALWYKDTKAMKHHKTGERHKVIPHLQPSHRV